MGFSHRRGFARICVKRLGVLHLGCFFHTRQSNPLRTILTILNVSPSPCRIAHHLQSAMQMSCKCVPRIHTRELLPPPLLLATRIFRISRIAGRIPPFNFFKVQTRLSRLQSGSKKNNHSVPAVFQSILPGSILPDSVASNGSRVRFTWSNQRLYLSSNDFEMDTAGFIPSGSSSPLLRPHLQPLLEDLQ